jgi:hypothetical protein
VRTIKTYKPGVARKVHIFSAALLWTIIGGLLLYRGVSYLIEAGELWLILPGIVAGTLKSYVVLDRSARSGLERIRKFSDNTCIGAVYSWKTWVAVLAMMLFGLLLRNLSLPYAALGTICSAIGWALLFSSRHAWRQWAHWKAEC